MCFFPRSVLWLFGNSPLNYLNLFTFHISQRIITILLHCLPSLKTRIFYMHDESDLNITRTKGLQ